MAYIGFSAKEGRITVNFPDDMDLGELVRMLHLYLANRQSAEEQLREVARSSAEDQSQ